MGPRHGHLLLARLRQGALPPGPGEKRHRRPPGRLGRAAGGSGGPALLSSTSVAFADICLHLGGARGKRLAWKQKQEQGFRETCASGSWCPDAPKEASGLLRAGSRRPGQQGAQGATALWSGPPPAGGTQTSSCWASGAGQFRGPVETWGALRTGSPTHVASGEWSGPRVGTSQH